LRELHPTWYGIGPRVRPHLLDSFTVSAWGPGALDLQAAEGAAALGIVITEDGGISPAYFFVSAGSTLSIDSVHALLRRRRGGCRTHNTGV
jgi:hypothetical protein